MTILSPTKLTIDIAIDIRENKQIVWENISSLVSNELNKNKEGLYESNLNKWANYDRGYGIEIQKEIEVEKQLLLVIYEYTCFYFDIERSYSVVETPLDDRVRDYIELLLKVIGKDLKTYEDIRQLGDTLDFKKFFTPMI